MKKLLLLISISIVSTYMVAQSCGKILIVQTAIVKTNDAPHVQTSDALWICEDRNVEIQGNLNTVYVEKNTLVTLVGNDNVAYVKKGASITITGDGNTVIVDSNVVAANEYDDQGTNTVQKICNPDPISGTPLKFDYQYFTSTTGCIDTSYTGVQTVEKEIAVTLYPNPVSSVLNVTVNKKDVPSDYKIYSISGKLVMSGRMVNNPQQIDLSNLEKGLYFIELQSDKGKVSRRISVE